MQQMTLIQIFTGMIGHPTIATGTNAKGSIGCIYAAVGAIRAGAVLLGCNIFKISGQIVESNILKRFKVTVSAGFSFIRMVVAFEQAIA